MAAFAVYVGAKNYELDVIVISPFEEMRLYGQCPGAVEPAEAPACPPAWEMTGPRPLRTRSGCRRPTRNGAGLAARAEAYHPDAQKAVPFNSIAR